MTAKTLTFAWLYYKRVYTQSENGLFDKGEARIIFASRLKPLQNQTL